MLQTIEVNTHSQGGRKSDTIIESLPDKLRKGFFFDFQLHKGNSNRGNFPLISPIFLYLGIKSRANNITNKSLILGEPFKESKIHQLFKVSPYCFLRNTKRSYKFFGGEDAIGLIII